MIPGRIVALDLSLRRTGVAYGSPEGRIEHRVATSTATGEARLDELDRKLSSIWLSAALVVIEEYAFSKGSDGHAHGIGELGGTVKLHLWRESVPYVTVSPSALKKYATGKGNASKELVLTEAVRRLAYSGADTNEADAIWLLAMAYDAYGMPLASVPQINRDGITKVAWPSLLSSSEKLDARRAAAADAAFADNGPKG